MILTLLAVTLNDQPLSRPITARFDASGGTIGRADHSTMALPDPERFISRKQAEIVFVNGGFMIRNLGAANPITVAGRALAGGETAMLADGDEVRIGGYQLRAQVQAAAELTPAPRTLRTVSLTPAAPASTGAPAQSPAPSAVPPPRPRPGSGAPTPAPVAASNPFADLLGPAPMTAAAAAHPDDPFADLLGAAPAASPSPVASAPAAAANPFEGLLPPPAGVDQRSAAVAAPAPPAARLPDDFDPFQMPGTPPSPPPGPPPADPFADLMPAAGRPTVDANFGLEGKASGDDALARFVSDFESPAGAGAAAPAIPVDPLALFGPGVAEPAAPPAAGADFGPAIGREAAAAPGPLPQADNLSDLNAAYVPPPRVAPPAPTAAARAAAPPSSMAVDEAQAQALWSAFCAGAQVQLPLPAGSGVERMQIIGRILRSAVEGTLQLMAVRASTKHEMRAAVTQIQARSNNPLKFSPDGASGIEQLVQPPARGFLDGPAAMDDAMRDLVAHSIGTVAGMRAAIEGMLDRFDPAELEGKLTGGSVLDSVLPMNRKARLWELYLQHYRAIREEAQEDFHTLFGKAFVAAYEQQVERLKQRPRS